MYHAPNVPQSVGGVLDSGFALFRAALKATFWLAFVGALLSAPFNRAAQSAATGDPGLGAAAAFLLLTLIIFVLSIVIYGAVIARVDATARGGELSIREALGVGWRRGPSFFLTSILFALAVGCGFLLLIIPGVFLMVMWIFAMIAAVVERTGPIESLKYSHQLVRGHWWRTAALLTIIGIIVSVLYALLMFVAGLVAAFNPDILIEQSVMPWYVDFIIIPLVSGVLGPLGYSLFMAVYNDLKLRREGGDIAERIAAAEA